MKSRGEGNYASEEYHMQSLLKDYAALVNQPARLLNGSGSYMYVSNPALVEDRTKALRTFLCSPNSTKVDAMWGGTIYSEIWAYILATKTLLQLPQAAEIYVLD